MKSPSYLISCFSIACLAALPSIAQTQAAPTSAPATSVTTSASATEPIRELNKTIIAPSGLQYKFTQLGTGPAPKSGDLMVIHGIGLYTDGKEFWNTRTENAPYEFTPGVDRVIKGFEEGMKYVREGDRIVITMKPELAYGARGNGDIPPNSTLVFDYEILSVHPLTVAKLVREATAAGKLDEELARVQKLPNFKDYYATPTGLVSIATRANRTHAGDGEKILTFGTALLPDAYQIPQALAKSQAQRGDKEDAIKNYDAALKLNKKDSKTAQTDFDAATKALEELKAK
jgi:FKBP-type peptidyl-prolyl cis-trans isomerase